MTDDFNVLLRQANDALRGPPDEAVLQLCEKLAAARPKRADSWFNLAWVQRALGRYEQAVTSYGLALDCGVSNPEEVHLNRAVIFSEFLDRGQDARLELDRALALRPDFPAALVNLGILHEDAGDREGASDTYRRLLAVDPDNARALSRLAALGQAEMVTAEALRAAAAKPDYDSEERAELLFALGRVLDELGQFDDAFAAIAQGNALMQSLVPPGKRYDAVRQRARVDQILAAFATALPTGGSNEEGPSPVFICGMFRSGSTLIEQILAAHPDIMSGGELDALPRVVEASLPNYPGGMSDLSGESYVQLREEYLCQVPRGLRAEKFFTDKRVDNIAYVGLIKAIFPGAKILITERAALDNILSAFFLDFGSEINYAFTPLDAADMLISTRRLSAHWQQLFPGDVHIVDYDVLVREPRAVIAAMLASLGLPWDERCLSFHDAPANVRTASSWQVRQPIHARSAGRWRAYASHLQPTIEFLAEHQIPR